MDTINQANVANTTVEYWAEMAEALERLEKNEDYKKVFVEGYFKDKAVAGVSILASDQVKESGRRTDVMEGLIAISSLQDHLQVIKTLGQAAKDDAEYDEVEDQDATYDIES